MRAASESVDLRIREVRVFVRALPLPSCTGSLRGRRVAAAIRCSSWLVRQRTSAVSAAATTGCCQCWTSGGQTLRWRRQRTYGLPSESSWDTTIAMASRSTMRTRPGQRGLHRSPRCQCIKVCASSLSGVARAARTR